MGIIKKLSPFEAPKRFIFEDPDTKHKYQAPSKAELIQQIISYREQNRLESIQALPSVLEHYWCGLPENSGKCREAALKRGWQQYLKGGVFLLKNLFFGEGNMVSQEEAERRATICVSCPHNIFHDKGPFVKWTDDLAEACTGGRRVSLNEALGECEICTCVLKAKVHAKGPFKLSLDEQKQLPSFCWQLEDSVARVPLSK